jgi:hypothetical protein
VAAMALSGGGAGALRSSERVTVVPRAAARPRGHRPAPASHRAAAILFPMRAAACMASDRDVRMHDSAGRPDSFGNRYLKSQQLQRCSCCYFR